MLKPGDNVGRYQIISLLARGGMAEVWLARVAGAKGFRKKVVIKTILSHLATDAAFREMFINEAMLASGLDHPNLVQIFDLGEHEETFYIAMEFVAGRSLRQIVRELRRRKRRMPAWAILRVLVGVCEGLQYAHDLRDEEGRPLGLVHRDISPENIMVAFNGGTKLLDFGVAKATADSRSLTRTGGLKGKYSYMPPEQIHRQAIDRRADVYALGVVLYELLTGRRPFRADSDLALLRQIVDGDKEEPKKLAPWMSDELRDIVLRAMHPSVDKRFEGAQELADALRLAMKDELHHSSRELGGLVTSLFPQGAELESGRAQHSIRRANEGGSTEEMRDEPSEESGEVEDQLFEEFTDHDPEIISVQQDALRGDGGDAAATVQEDSGDEPRIESIDLESGLPSDFSFDELELGGESLGDFSLERAKAPPPPPRFSVVKAKKPTTPALEQRPTITEASEPAVRDEPATEKEPAAPDVPATEKEPAAQDAPEGDEKPEADEPSVDSGADQPSPAQQTGPPRSLFGDGRRKKRPTSPLNPFHASRRSSRERVSVFKKSGVVLEEPREAEAEEDQPQAEAVDSVGAQAHFAKGLAYLRDGELDLAKIEWERAIELDATNKKYSFNMAHLARRLAERDEES